MTAPASRPRTGSGPSAGSSGSTPRAAATRHEAGGSGLGLAIVRATALAHGGSARLEDASPGLRAVVRLPAALPADTVR